MVLVGWLLHKFNDLKRQLAWLRKQQFGRKSETQTDGIFCQV